MRANKDSRDEVVVIQTLEIPPVVDFDHLGDPEKGYLIGEKAKAMLEDVMQAMPPGRYKKIVVRNKLLEKYSQDEIEAAFPHNRVWGMIKDPDNELHAVYLGKSKKVGGVNKLLGKGGFGKVKVDWSFKKKDWDAVKVTLHEIPAVQEEKMLKKLNRGGGLIKRKKRKVELIAGVKHEKDEMQSNVIMDYVKGVNLHTYLINHPQSPARLVDIALQIAEQVVEMHEQGYLHCDIKPPNIMYDPISGKVKIIDVGLALEMEGKTVVQGKRYRGTQGYAAPEVARGVFDYSVSTDMFSLGATLRVILGFGPIVFKDEDESKPVYTTTQFWNDKELDELLRSMVTAFADKRAIISKQTENEKKEEGIISRLRGLHNELIPVSPITTGILNIADYQNATPEGRLVFIHALSAVDSVILVDTEQRGDVVYYSKIRRAIEEAGRVIDNQFRLAVDSKIVIAKNPSLAVQKIREQENKLQDKKQNETMISHLCYFQPQGKPVKLEEAGVQSIEVTSATRNYKSEIINRATPVTDAHLLEVREALYADLQRYMQKHSVQFNTVRGGIESTDPARPVSDKTKNRIGILQKALGEIQDFRNIENRNEKINYTTLFAKLDSWQNELIQSHSKKRQVTFRFSFIQPKPKGMQKLGEVSEKIKKEGPVLPKMRPLNK